MSVSQIDRTPSQPLPSTPPRSRRAPVWLVLVATSVPMFMATLDNLVMTTALPVVMADLKASVG
ncbi:MAG: hypothetical protein ACXWDM_15250, partial [Nocardioides sp.]